MLIELKSVTAGYGRNTILRDIDLKIEQGEKVFIGGANGSGKTTLLRVIAGLIPYKGEVLIMGRDIKSYKRKELARIISLMPQQNQIYFAYKVKDAVSLGRYAHTSLLGSDPKENSKITYDVMKTCGILDLKDRFLNELSGGQVQRVMLAMCFCQASPVILLDEPGSNLDIKYNAEIEKHINVWMEDSSEVSGMPVKNTAIAVFHDLSQALRFSGRAVLLKEGRIFYDGSLEDAVTGGIASEVYDFDIANYKREEQSLWNFVQPDR